MIQNEALLYKVIVTNKDGKEVFREAESARSFTEQWNKVVYAQARQTTLSITDVDGISRSINNNEYNFLANAGIGNIAQGIRVGIGITPVDISDYALEAPIEHGTGPGQLQHQEMHFTGSVASGSECSFTIWRVMFNNSGADLVAVREIGCHFRIGNYYGLAFKDVLALPATIPYGGAITVTYTLKVTE
ncbi:MAG: hypothetical protein JW712_09255 [Dehalococcoidales bacterium]|nr:hypothetical protein [Dehalococcoidales bacterium]